MICKTINKSIYKIERSTTKELKGHCLRYCQKILIQSKSSGKITIIMKALSNFLKRGWRWNSRRLEVKIGYGHHVNLALIRYPWPPIRTLVTLLLLNLTFGFYSSSNGLVYSRAWEFVGPVFISRGTWARFCAKNLAFRDLHSQGAHPCFMSTTVR